MHDDALTPVEHYLASQHLLGERGGVLYSSIKTITEGPVYLLGLNPGGNEATTLRESLQASRSGNNAYLDEEWAPGGHVQPRGQSILQRRVQQLCAHMRLKTREVPASNLVFTRSTRLHEHTDYDSALRVCLPVHQILLDTIKPQFLMTFGALTNVAKAGELSGVEQRLAGHGTWKAHRGRIRIGDHNMEFGNIPHMSLYASDAHPDVVGWAISGLYRPS